MNALSDRTLVDTLLRNDFPSFVQRCFQTLNPSAPFLDNWHLAAIGYQLGLCATRRNQ